MTNPNVTFLSYNSTGMNTIKSRWIRDLVKVTEASYVQLQEHFKSSKTTNQFFSDQFPDYSSFVIPGHREKYQDNGRAKGGLAQLSRIELDVKKNRLKTSSFRIQAQVLNFPTVNILWINAYFPTDPQLINYDEIELQQILNEIENIMDTSQYDEVIFGADFNWDRSRNTGYVACMERWVERIGLQDVWDTYPVDYTHVHTDMRSLSTLDRFLVSPGLLPHITDAGPIHLGDNPSRHSPIMLKLSLESLPIKKPCSQTIPKRPAWYKAEEADINSYTFQLHNKLADLPHPPELNCHDPHCTQAEHLQARDSYLLDVMIAMRQPMRQPMQLYLWGVVRGKSGTQTRIVRWKLLFLAGEMIWNH